MALSKADLESIAAMIAMANGSASDDAPDADDDAKAAPKSAKATTASRSRKVTIPTFKVHDDDVLQDDAMTRVDFTQVYATKGSEQRAAVAFKSHGGFRVSVITTDDAGRSRTYNLPAAVVHAIRDLSDASIGKLTTDARA